MKEMAFVTLEFSVPRIEYPLAKNVVMYSSLLQVFWVVLDLLFDINVVLVLLW